MNFGIKELHARAERSCENCKCKVRRGVFISRRRIFAFFLVPGLCLDLTLSLPCLLLADEGIQYQVNIKGVTDKKLRRVLEEVSNTWRMKKRLPASMSLLRQRVKGDIPQIFKALRSQGYYGANVETDIDVKAEPVRIIFSIDLGSPYILTAVDIRIPEEKTALIPTLPEARVFGLSLGERAKSKSILDAGKELIRWLRNKGFPFPRLLEKKVVVDHKAHTVSVTYHVEAGPPARFGNTEISGLESVDEAFIRNRIHWKSGDRFKGDLLSQLQKRLSATGLFSTVQVSGAETVDKDGHLSINIAVKERKHRTIKAGVSYKTDEGPGARLSWEHRNLFRRGERLILKGMISEIALEAESTFRKPAFLRLDQSLLLSLRAAEDRPDAFTSRNLGGSLEIERELSKEITASAGVAFKAATIDQYQYDKDEKESFGLLSLPLRLNWDTSDRLLDPSRGGRLAFQTAPYYDTFGSDVAFIKGTLGYRRYIGLWKRPPALLACRGAIGAAAGAARDAIPADERFYAGGGNSVRGFPYQSVSPLRDEEPVGGRSLLEFSLELRLKVTDTIGFVAFLDGGSAFESVFPDFVEQLGWGTGIGFRYFTPIGPLRLDVGVPLNRRDEIDDAFQVYVSIGQAF